MCERCTELDKKLGRYRVILARAPDQQLAEGLAKLIEEAEAEKAALHREQEK
jgi:hypothetical protein